MKNILFILLITTATSGYAQSKNDSSKRSYNLFHPVPENQMRSFETDRPDVTESAYTVDAGHFQVETDLFKTAHYNIDNIRTINNYFNTANIKLGITNSLDFQLVVSTLNSSKLIGNNIIEKQSGFGGFTFRVKQNIWGNDNGKTALAILPYLNFLLQPIKNFREESYFPLLCLYQMDGTLGQRWSELANNQVGNNYHFNFLVSATTSHSLCKNLDFFIEGVVTKDNQSKLYEYFIDGGPTYSISENLHIDCGVYYGLKDISSKTYFIGLSFRI